MIITIAGMPGSGKTSVAKELSKRLGVKLVSAGDRLAVIANDNKITIDELLARNDDADYLIDGYQKQLGESKEPMIIEGKISWYLIPDSFKILVTCDEDEGARRIYEDWKNGNRSDEPDYKNIEEAKKANTERVARFIAKFKKLYGIEKYYDPSRFDFVLDTTHSSGPEENADKIINAMKEKGVI